MLSSFVKPSGAVLQAQWSIHTVAVDFSERGANEDHAMLTMPTMSWNGRPSHFPWLSRPHLCLDLPVRTAAEAMVR
ncbi:hypothetical protein SPHV1_2280007 [Novosphingobium sp. KN65.2]|nr:hypothetical protein SPHV1_2280007 [Novosphingobium sp. KN65.2]